MNYINIHYQGKIYKICRERKESFDSFYKRAWFIVKRTPGNQNEFNTIEKTSFIWRNSKISGLTYSDDVEKLII